MPAFREKINDLARFSTQVYGETQLDVSVGQVWVRYGLELGCGAPVGLFGDYINLSTLNSLLSVVLSLQIFQRKIIQPTCIG